jgi:hypothetical protein
LLNWKSNKEYESLIIWIKWTKCRTKIANGRKTEDDLRNTNEVLTKYIYRYRVMESEYLSLQQEKQQAKDAANQKPGPNKWGKATSPAILAKQLKEVKQKFNLNLAGKAEGIGLLGNIMGDSARTENVRLKERLGELNDVQLELKVAKYQLQKERKAKEKLKNKVRELKKAHHTKVTNHQSRILELEEKVESLETNELLASVSPDLGKELEKIRTEYGIAVEKSTSHTVTIKSLNDNVEELETELKWVKRDLDNKKISFPTIHY